MSLQLSFVSHDQMTNEPQKYANGEGQRKLVSQFYGIVLTTGQNSTY